MYYGVLFSLSKFKFEIYFIIKFSVGCRARQVVKKTIENYDLWGPTAKQNPFVIARIK